MRSVMSPEAKVEALREIDVFTTWSADQITALADRAEEAVYAPGAVLLRDGQRSGPRLFVILSGEASAAGPAGTTVVGPGSVLGDVDGASGIGGAVPTAATVTALTLMHVFTIT